MATPSETDPVHQLVDAGIFGFALPASHSAKWKSRRLGFGRDPSKAESLVPFVLKSKAGETALKNAAHAVITGLGLLFLFNDKRCIVDILELAGVKSVLVTGTWITIDTNVQGKYCFRFRTSADAKRWQTDIVVRSAEATTGTLRTTKIFEDARLRIKNEAENAKSRKSKKPKVKRQALSVPIELKNLSDTTALEEPSPDKIVCAICYEDFRRSDVAEDTHFATHEICNDCITQYITTKIGSGATKILCLVPECSADLSYDDIKRQVEKEKENIFIAYDERIFREAAKKDPNFRWCANPKCGAANIVDDAQAIYFQCPTCKADTCFSCGEYAHPKRTCEEYRRYVQDRGIPAGDAPTVAYLNRVSVTCYSCSALLQRVEGCVLISCLNCRSQCCAGCGGRGHGHECRRLPVS